MPEQNKRSVEKLFESVLQPGRPRPARPARGARIRRRAGRQGAGRFRASWSGCAPPSPTSTTRSMTWSPRATGSPCAGTGRGRTRAPFRTFPPTGKSLTEHRRRDLPVKDGKIVAASRSRPIAWDSWTDGDRAARRRAAGAAPGATRRQQVSDYFLGAASAEDCLSPGYQWASRWGLGKDLQRLDLRLQLDVLLRKHPLPPARHR